MNNIISLKPKNSLVKVHNFFEPLPDFMHDADVIYSDPPWIQANITYFFNKAGLPIPDMNYTDFVHRFLQRAYEINPDFLFIEMGKASLGYWLEQLKLQYRYVTFYNSTYYNKITNKCYVIHASKTASNKRIKILEDMKSNDILMWLCGNLNFKCIGDFCMGTGMTGKCAYLNNRRFVGTELNEKRLQHLINFIKKHEEP